MHIIFDRNVHINIDGDTLTIKFGSMRETVIRRRIVDFIHIEDNNITIIFEQGTIELHDVHNTDIEDIKVWAQPDKS